MNFERGGDIKAILEIGGVDLQKKYDETVKAWKLYFKQFVGRTVKFHVYSSVYCNWEDRIKKGELVEIKTLIVKEASDEYGGHPGHLFFTEEESSQCWFVDLSHKIYILK
jgi:hypothetical protein